ncbi:glycosyltransferase family 2 protein [Aeromonas veronii]|uniref:glycosyltransferase family 2 protein n=1 Tax=Aeromonas veronii TaxID=654 RepID=UPI0011175B9D|nr:glycosyltransferase [Aeromonas veronii]
MTAIEYKPKVSVMIITYNQEALISETIESVINQNYENIEIIVADDASTDNTPAIINEYAKRYPGVVIPVLNSTNLGITGNSNAAFFSCTGELIAVLGGDDLFLNGKIQSQVELFRDPNVVLSYHPVEIFLHQTNETLFITNMVEREKINDVYDLITKGGIPGASSVMVRRSACPSHGFDPQFPVVSDWIFFIEVALQGKISSLSEVYGRYRKHGKGASERTLELLDESLNTLDVVVERYGQNDKHLLAICKQGKIRYVMGEIYRQIIKGSYDTVKRLSHIILENSDGAFKYKVFVTIVTNRNLFTIMSGALPKLKYVIKRYLS